MNRILGIRLLALLIASLIFLAMACSGNHDADDDSDSGPGQVQDDDNANDDDDNDNDDNADDDDDNDDDNDNDDDDNDDNDDDNDNDDNDDNDDTAIALIDGGAPGHNGTSLVRSDDGRFYLAAVRGRELAVYSWTDKAVTREAVASPASGPLLRLAGDGSLRLLYLDPTTLELRFADNRPGAWAVVPVPDSATEPEEYSLALDADDHAHVTYPTAAGEIVYATDLTGAWESTVIDENNDAYSKTSIAIDAGGMVHLVFEALASPGILYATDASGSWQTVAATDHGYEPLLALDAAGAPCIVYRYFSELLYACRGAGDGLWPEQTVNSSIKWDYLQYGLAFAADGAAHVSYYAYNYTGASSFLGYATNRDGNWRNQVADFAEYLIGQYTSIVLDDDGHPFISYYYPDKGYLKLAARTGLTWTRVTIDDVGFVKNASLAARGHRRADVAYRLKDVISASLKSASNAAGPWSGEMVADEEAGSYQGIAIGTDGRTRIAFSDIYDHTLRYATAANDGWQFQTVEPQTSKTLWGVALALDGQNAAHLAYAFANELRYATDRAGQWEIQTVVADYFYNPAIALDDDGAVHVAAVANGYTGVYATDRSGDWEAEIFAGTGSVTGAISIAPAADGVVHLAYVTAADSPGAMYATNQSGAWETESLAPASGAIATAIALDADQVRVAYFAAEATPAGIYLAVKTSGEWTTVWLADCEGEVSDLTLVLAADGRLRVAYLSDGGLYYRAIPVD